MIDLVHKAVSPLIISLLTATSLHALPQQYPFFDGTDAKTATLMKDAEKSIEKIRKGELSIDLFDHDGKPVNAPVTIELYSHEFSFGANLFGFHKIPDVNPAKQRAVSTIKELFNTAVICDYWSVNQRIFQGDLDWNAPDYSYQLAEKLQMRTRHHALIFGFPHWLHNYESEAAIWAAIEGRIRSVAERYGDKITEADVINEFINYQYWAGNPHADYLKTTHFPDFAKPENGARVLKIARKYLPETKLVVLEANIWSVSNPVFQEIFNYHKKLIELGADYDYIGYQAHYYAKNGLPFQEGTREFGPRTFMMDEIDRGIEQIAQLGKPIVITEFNGPSRSNKSKSKDQPRISDREIAAWESNFYTLMFSKPYIKGVTRWFTIDNLGGRGMDAGVITEDGDLKPNCFALKKLIKEKWHTRWEGNAVNGKVNFRGFYGSYLVKIKGRPDVTVKLTSANPAQSITLANLKEAGNT